MSKEYISIQQASKLGKKSVQTIRRAIKAKKLKCRKRKTPQGFNYLVSLTSLYELYNMRIEEPVIAAEPKAEAKVKKDVKTEINKVVSEDDDSNVTITTEDFREFTRTLETLVHQHSEERQNFLRLVNTLQEKIFVMENQLNLLKSPAKKWYQLWK